MRSMWWTTQGEMMRMLPSSQYSRDCLATQEDGNHLEKRSAERDAEGRIQTQVVDELEDSTTQLELDNGTEIVCGVNSIGTDKAKSN